MHRTTIAVACVVTLTACPRITYDDLVACKPSEPIGWLVVTRIVSIPGFFRSGDTLFVGDTLPLTAEARPVIGGMTDLYGGECYAEYGDPVHAGVEWWTSDDRIATVSTTGVVSARAPGNVVITGKLPLGGSAAGLPLRVFARGDVAP